MGGRKWDINVDFVKKKLVMDALVMTSMKPQQNIIAEKDMMRDMIRDMTKAIKRGNLKAEGLFVYMQNQKEHFASGLNVHAMGVICHANICAYTKN